MARSVIKIKKLLLQAMFTGFVAVQMTLTPLAEIRASCIDSDPVLAKDNEECAKHPSKRWDERSCRCVNQEDLTNTREEFEKCAEEPDLVKRKECMEKNRNTLVGKEGMELEFPDGANEWVEGIYATALGAGVALAAINFFSKSGSASCLSKTVFSIGAVAGLLAELYFYFFLKNELDDIAKKYKDSAESDPMTMQVKAFEYLKEEQLKISDMAGKKKTIYMVLMAAYFAAAAIALVEIFAPMTLKPCTPESAGGGAKSPSPAVKRNMDWPNQAIDLSHLENFQCPETLGVEDIALLSQVLHLSPEESGMLDELIRFGKTLPQESLNSILPAAVAEDEPSPAGTPGIGTGNTRDYHNPTFKLFGFLIGAGGSALLITQVEPLKQMFNSSVTIAIVAAIAATLALTMFINYSDLETKAKENAALVQKVLDKFKDATSTFCSPADRENLSKPDCYCYTSDGEQNPGRGNSDICQNLFKDRSKKAALTATDYDSATGGPKTGCMTVTQQFDEECKCRRFTSKSTGENACFKVSPNNLNFPGLGSDLGLKPLAEETNKIAQDSSQAGFLDSKRFAVLAARNKQHFRTLLKKMNKKFISEGKKPLVFDKKLANNFLSKLAPENLIKASQGGGINAVANLASTRPDNPALNEAVNQSGMAAYSGGGGVGKVTEKKGGLDFGLEGDKSSGGSGSKVQDFMGKTYNTRDNDITKDDSVSIWKVISKRYTNSGMRRLFEEEGDEKEDASAQE